MSVSPTAPISENVVCANAATTGTGFQLPQGKTLVAAEVRVFSGNGSVLAELSLPQIIGTTTRFAIGLGSGWIQDAGQAEDRVVWFGRFKIPRAIQTQLYVQIYNHTGGSITVTVSAVFEES